MIINKIALKDYRSYHQGQFAFDKGLNIIIGPNGIGKTNILESIIVVSNTKSFRTNNEKALINNDGEFARIDILSDVGKFRVVINSSGKSLIYNDQIRKKTSEFIGKLNAILFKPSDLELFDKSPRERRKIMDIEIGKINHSYLNALLKYNLLLKEKNALLKEEKIDEVLLSIIDGKMLPEMQRLIAERTAFFEKINPLINAYYQKLSNTSNKIFIDYHKCCPIDELMKRIKASFEKDKYYHYATFGPHHEDYVFKMDDIDLCDIASQGQKRMTFISFKLAIADYIRMTTGTAPIILLDDILSELDSDNQERLLNILPADTQTIITSTDIKMVDIKRKYNLIRL